MKRSRRRQNILRPFLRPTVELGRNGSIERSIKTGDGSLRSGQRDLQRSVRPSRGAQSGPRTLSLLGGAEAAATTNTLLALALGAPSLTPPRSPRVPKSPRERESSKSVKSRDSLRSAPRSLSLPLLPSLLTFASRNQLGVEMHDTCWAILNFALGVSRF